MSIRRYMTRTAGALIGAAALTTALAAPALALTSYYDSGYGTTADAAEKAAIMQLHADAYGCGPASLVSDTPNGDGTWYAVVIAQCRGLN